jgi:hypothetical protein
VLGSDIHRAAVAVTRWAMPSSHDARRWHPTHHRAPVPDDDDDDDVNDAIDVHDDDLDDLDDLVVTGVVAVVHGVVAVVEGGGHRHRLPAVAEAGGDGGIVVAVAASGRIPGPDPVHDRRRCHDAPELR